MTSDSEKELVARAQKDPDAFGEIFDLHYERILRYSLQRVGDADIAADIAAEVFMKAMKGLIFFRWRGISILAWLYRIASNECNMYFRRGKYAPVSLSLLEENGYEPQSETLVSERRLMEEMLQQEASGARVVTELRKLSPHYQEVITLRYTEDLTCADIARILGKREGTVRSLLSRGLAQLRTQMQHSELTSIRESESQLSASVPKV